MSTGMMNIIMITRSRQSTLSHHTSPCQQGDRRKDVRHIVVRSPHSKNTFQGDHRKDVRHAVVRSPHSKNTFQGDRRKDVRHIVVRSPHPRRFRRLHVGRDERIPEQAVRGVCNTKSISGVLFLTAGRAPEAGVILGGRALFYIVFGFGSVFCVEVVEIHFRLCVCSGDDDNVGKAWGLWEI